MARQEAVFEKADRQIVRIPLVGGWQRRGAPEKRGEVAGWGKNPRITWGVLGSVVTAGGLLNVKRVRKNIN